MRLEYKYLVPVERLDALRTQMRPYLRVDGFVDKTNANKGYTVRSIYFDTPRMDYHFEKIEGIGVRKKIRVRGYNALTDRSAVFLEIKRKNVNLIAKDRAPLFYRDLEDLFRTRDVDRYIQPHHGSGESIEPAKRFFFHVCGRSLEPSVLVSYDREAFYARFNPLLRITFDKNLRFSMRPSLNELFDESKLRRTMGRHFILEVKFQRGLPSWLRDVITQNELERMALSKYTLCVDAHRRLGQVDPANTFVSRVG